MTRRARRGIGAAKAAAFIEPLRAALGARQSVDAARSRLLRHDAAIAPVILDDRPIAVVTRERLDEASRFGLGALPIARIVTRGAPHAGIRSGGKALRAASRNVAPGILVLGKDGHIAGTIAADSLRSAVTGVPGIDGHRLLKRAGPEHGRVLSAAGRAGVRLGMPVHLVGGAVRDLLLNRRIRSIDLAVEGDGILFARHLARALRARVARHSVFGTAEVALSDGTTIDVASTRRENYRKAAALPVVAPASIDADLMRRDLTINAIAVRIDGPGRGMVRDPLGGRDDLRSGLLRVVHRLSFVEDPTRAFRAARFASRLGMRWHEETQSALALARSVEAFAELSPQRRFREFVLLTSEPDPASALRQVMTRDLLSALVPGVSVDRRLAGAWRRLARAARVFDAVPPPGPGRALLALGVLLAATPRRHAHAALAHLGVTGEPAERLGTLAARVASLQRALRRSLRGGLSDSTIARICGPAGDDALIAGWCLGDAPARRAVERYVRRVRPIRPLVTGADLRRMGVPPGPIYGAILGRILEARLDGAFEGKSGAAGREAELRMARRLAGLT